jgi:hypothetical protein
MKNGKGGRGSFMSGRISDISSMRNWPEHHFKHFNRAFHDFTECGTPYPQSTAYAAVLVRRVMLQFYANLFLVR